MNLFDWLLVAHLVGDFLLQTDGMAKHKVHRWPWMLRHVGLYMAVISVVLLIYGLRQPDALWAVVIVWLFLALTHVILDRRVFTAWWMRSVGISPEHPWLSIVVDQVFHVLTLAIAAQVLTSVGG
jgi:hypothetical protein